jgi:hypothetical protein
MMRRSCDTTVREMCLELVEEEEVVILQFRQQRRSFRIVTALLSISYYGSLVLDSVTCVACLPWAREVAGRSNAP